MAYPDAAWNRPEPAEKGYWQRIGAALPMRTALLAVASVWILGCVWSFQEQSDFAASKGFIFPHLLPLVIDGFAVSMAGVAWAASLDARPAIPARLATLVAVATSSASNGIWAYLRANHDMVTVAIGVAVPVAANLAFEVLLAELRRQVQRRRGLPPPVAVPYPRMIRLVLSPFRTFFEWRRLVLELTAMDLQVSRAEYEERRPIPVTAAASVEPVERDAPKQVETTAPDIPAIAGPARAPDTERPQPARPAAPAPMPPRTPASRPAQSQPAQSRPVQTQPAQTRPVPTQPARPAPAAAASTTPASVDGHSLERTPTPAMRPTTPASVVARPGPAVATNGNGAPSRPGIPVRTTMNGNGNGPHEPTDPEEAHSDQRVEQLARILAEKPELEDDLTGEKVVQLLGIDVAPRTGRRLLGQARELAEQRARARAKADGLDPELSVIGGR
ncbi:hypothetical protein GCM10023321_57760 [Pseudonocardia eucalypti]|uniref:DUF2637 domain-containing protein n=1 Tax=Pseudonocardia eucalypti TaxID=648755 RepID=A0ABP9QSD5_9PSEU|nr:hypothetical protein [Pseudonocardia eucalypti]